MRIVYIERNIYPGIITVRRHHQQYRNYDISITNSAKDESQLNLKTEEYLVGRAYKSIGRDFQIFLEKYLEQLRNNFDVSSVIASGQQVVLQLADFRRLLAKRGKNDSDASQLRTI